MSQTTTATRTVTVRHYDRGCGNHQTIVESPWAEALAVIDGLARATNDATYRNVRFGRKLQQKLVVYLRVDLSSPEWAVIRDAGTGPHTFTEEYLDSLLAAAAKIEEIIAKAVPATPDYPCRNAFAGCGIRVKTKGAYCPRCQHDEE